jgi:hypothetical protein
MPVYLGLIYITPQLQQKKNIVTHCRKLFHEYKYDNSTFGRHEKQLGVFNCLWKMTSPRCNPFISYICRLHSYISIKFKLGLVSIIHISTTALKQFVVSVLVNQSQCSCVKTVFEDRFWGPIFRRGKSRNRIFFGAENRGNSRKSRAEFALFKRGFSRALPIIYITFNTSITRIAPLTMLSQTPLTLQCFLKKSNFHRWFQESRYYYYVLVRVNWRNEKL